MKKTNAMRILESKGIAFRVEEYQVDPADLSAQTVAAKLGLEPASVYKTLVIQGKAGVYIAVLTGDRELAPRKLARLAGERKVAMVPLNELNDEALIDILTKPKNALIKQYQKLFEFEDVRLRFTEGALRAVARQALKRKSGARGLRSILESVMLDLMYEIPSRDDVEECVINEEVIEQGSKPLMVLKQEAESA